MHTSASSAVCLAITLKSKISQESFKELYWESFIASEQSACIWLMCVSFCLIECKMPANPGKSPLGTGSSMLSQDINALGLGSFKLLSSSETPPRKQAFDVWAPSILYFSAGMFNMIVKNKQANGCFFKGHS